MRQRDDLVLLVPDQRGDDEVLLLADGLDGRPLAQMEFFRVEADHPRQYESVLAKAWLFAGMTLAGVGIFGYATGVLMAPFAPVLGDRLPELTCLQVAFTGERFCSGLRLLHARSSRPRSRGC